MAQRPAQLGRGAGRENAHPLHSLLEGTLGGPDLRDHSAREGAQGDARLHLQSRERAHQAAAPVVGIAAHAAAGAQEEQVTGADRTRDGGSQVIGIDVEGLSPGVGGDARQNWRIPQCEQLSKPIRLNTERHTDPSEARYRNCLHEPQVFP